MASELEVMNRALARIGEETQISDPDTLTPGRQLRVIRQLLPSIRDSVLRSYPWLSATRRRSLSKLNVSSTGDWAYASAYQLPGAVLRVWGVDTCAPWQRGKAVERDGGGLEVAVRDAILCATAADTLRVVTIERVPYEELDAGVIDAIVGRLASDIAGPLQADKAVQKMLRDQLPEVFADATAQEMSEFGNQDIAFESAWLLARDGASSYDGSGPPPGYAA